MPNSPNTHLRKTEPFHSWGYDICEHFITLSKNLHNYENQQKLKIVFTNYLHEIENYLNIYFPTLEKEIESQDIFAITIETIRTTIHLAISIIDTNTKSESDNKSTASHQITIGIEAIKVSQKQLYELTRLEQGPIILNYLLEIHQQFNQSISFYQTTSQNNLQAVLELSNKLNEYINSRILHQFNSYTKMNLEMHDLEIIRNFLIVLITHLGNTKIDQDFSIKTLNHKLNKIEELIQTYQNIIEEKKPSAIQLTAESYSQI